MEKAPQFGVPESGTSNAVRGLGHLRQLPLADKEIFAADPYRIGTAPITTRLPDENDHRRLALSCPTDKSEGCPPHPLPADSVPTEPA
ncbi:hypothetical protein ACWGQ5_28840 [Streptomyces sp. NPDC055722]